MLTLHILAHFILRKTVTENKPQDMKTAIQQKYY